jgi:hypothetical protein
MRARDEKGTTIRGLRLDSSLNFKAGTSTMVYLLRGLEIMANDSPKACASKTIGARGQAFSQRSSHS